MSTMPSVLPPESSEVTDLRRLSAQLYGDLTSAVEDCAVAVHQEVLRHQNEADWLRGQLLGRRKEEGAPMGRLQPKMDAQPKAEWLQSQMTSLTNLMADINSRLALFPVDKSESEATEHLHGTLHCIQVAAAQLRQIQGELNTSEAI